MKLRLKLTEADKNAGRILLYLNEVYPQIEAWLKSENLGFKSDGSKGFYILPKFGHLVNFRLTSKDGNVIFSVSDVKHDKNSGEVIPGEFPLADFMENTKATTLFSEIVKHIDGWILTADELKKGSSNESFTLVEYANPFAAIKNAFTAWNNQRAAKAADKAQEKQNKLDAKASVDAIANDLAEALKKTYTKFKPAVTPTSDGYDVSIPAKYVAAVEITPASTDVSKPMVNKVTTADESYISPKSSLFELFKALNYELALGKDLGSLKKIFNVVNDDGADLATEDGAKSDDTKSSDSTPPAEDAKVDGNAKKVAGYGFRFDAIFDGVPQSAGKTGADIAKLLGIGESLDKSDSDMLIEALLPLANNTPSAGYLEVYKLIKNNKDAVVALTERFINQALNVPAEAVKKLRSSDIDLFNAYADKLANGGYKVSSKADPALYVMSKHLKDYKDFLHQIDNGLMTCIDRNSSLLPAIIADVEKTNSTSKPNVDDIFRNNISIVYCKELNASGFAAQILSLWYRNAETISKIKLADDEAGKKKKSDLGEIFNLDIDSKEITPAILLKAIFFGNGKFNTPDEIEKRLSQLRMVINAGANNASDKKTDTETDTPDNDAEELKNMDTQTLSSEIQNGKNVAMKDFIRYLNDTISNKSLDDTAMRELQTKILAQLA